MNRSTVQRRLTSYTVAKKNLANCRVALRRDVIAWRENGATVVEVAEALGWSRQSVYDLTGGKVWK